jgi:thiol:disulfide interchange protein DsbA
VFEPVLDAWIKQLPADVSFRREHVLFRPFMSTHQRTYFALQAMGKETEVRGKIFDALHRQGLRLDDQASMSDFLAKQGIDAAKFKAAFGSFGVDNKCRQADKLAEMYRIDGVPALGVGGRYLTSPAMAANGQRIGEEEMGVRAVQVANFLIDRVRKGG